MMIAIGNFLFHFRNLLFPLFYVALFIPSLGIFQSYKVAALVGFAVCLVGQGIRILTIGLTYIIRGGSKRRIYAKDLVTTGMFAHCRNPLYIGNILVLLGIGIMANSLMFLLTVVPFFLFAYHAIVLSEENYLLGRFGDQYREYMQDVGRWIPNLSGLGETLGSMGFKWKRVIIREYNATFIWVAGALIVFMKNVHSVNTALFNRILPYSITFFSLLAVLYSTVRYLKKSKKLKDE